jgi:hypothetical protein
MNTLNYKALLIKIFFILFARAIGIYLLMTIPALAALPVLYEMSAVYAVSFGWIAGVLFLLLFYLVQKIKSGILAKKIFLYASVAISVAVAFQMMEITGAQHRIWQSGVFLLFPATAVIAGWISTAISWRKINSLLAVNDDTNYYATAIDNNSPAPGKII